jgi:hypothetical protein
MEKETLVYVDLERVAHLVGRLWGARAITRRAPASNTIRRGLNIPRGFLWNRRCNLVRARTILRLIRQCSGQSGTRHRTGGDGH